MFKPLVGALALALFAGSAQAQEPPAPLSCTPLNDFMLAAPAGSFFKPLTDMQLLQVWDLVRKHKAPLPAGLKQKTHEGVLATRSDAPGLTFIFFIDSAGCMLEGHLRVATKLLAEALGGVGA
jgi:hypothetical protein